MSDTMNLDDLELELRKLPGVRAAGFTDAEDMLVVQVQVAADTPATAISQQAARIAYRHADKPVALEVVRWRTIETPAVAAPADVAVAPVDDPVVEPDVGGGDEFAETSKPVDGADSTPKLAVAAPGDDEAGDSTPTRLPRVRLLAVLTFPDTDELEVHLTYEGRRVIGRAAASGGVSGAVQATIEGLAQFAPDLGAKLLWAEEVAGHEDTHTSVVACGMRLGESTVLGIAAGGSRIEASARATLHALNRSLEDRLHAPA